MCEEELCRAQCFTGSTGNVDIQVQEGGEGTPEVLNIPSLKLTQFAQAGGESWHPREVGWRSWFMGVMNPALAATEEPQSRGNLAKLDVFAKAFIRAGSLAGCHHVQGLQVSQPWLSLHGQHKLSPTPGAPKPHPHPQMAIPGTTGALPGRT